MTEPLKILMLEDDPVDAEIIQRLLHKRLWGIEFNLVTTRSDYEKALEQSHPDLILADNSLPQFDASDALQVARLQSPGIPFIMVTGTVSEEYAVEMIKAGADDYILKDRLTRLPASIEAAINQQRAKREAQEAQDEIRRSNERFQALSRLTKDAVWDLDLVSNEIWWNESFFHLLGFTGSAVPDLEKWMNHIHPDDRVKMALRLEEIRKGVIVSWEDELCLQLPGGNIRTVLDRAYVLKHDRGIPVRLIGVLVDITEKRKMENEQIKLKIRQQKELARAILEAGELERTTLGRELHDNINQILASVNLRLGYYLDEPGSNRAILEDCRRGLEMAIREARHLSHQMVMPRFSEKSLRSELSLLIDHYISALSIKLEARKLNEKSIPPPVKEALYRIVQEQLNNIHKHAKASLVQVHLSTDTGSVALIIRDNGVGFNPKKKRKGIGITNIYNRAESFDGKVEIFSRSGAGCTLSIQIPLV
jgi:two-component system sensor histidine kinase UhpB